MVTVISGGREIEILLVGSRLLSSVTLCACSTASLQRIHPLCSAPSFHVNADFSLYVNGIKKNGCKRSLSWDVCVSEVLTVPLSLGVCVSEV